MLKRDGKFGSLFGIVLLIIAVVGIFGLIFLTNSVLTGEVALLIEDTSYFYLNQGEAEVQTFKLENPEEEELNVTFDASDFSDFVVSSEKSFILGPLESKKVKLDFLIEEGETPGIYPGKIIINFGTKRKILNSIVVIKQNKTIFKLDTEILTKKINLEEDLRSKIKISNIGKVKGIDASLNYFIIDFEGKIYPIEEEKIKLDEELEIEKTFMLPENLKPEESYVLHTKVSYAGLTANSGETFKVMKKGFNTKLIYLAILSIALLMGIIFLIIKIKNKLSKISMPKFKSPKISKPQIQKPKINTPKFKAPKISFPKFKFPKIKWPKFSLPKFKKPKIKTPEIEKPKIKLPKVSKPRFKFKWPKIKFPKFHLPRFEKPEIKTPNVKVEKPKINKPKFKLPRFSWPKIKFPKFSLPKFKSPKISKPRIEKPKVKLPKINKPRFKWPKIKFPKFHFPKFRKSKFKKPEIKVERPKKPKFKFRFPKIRWPRFHFPRFHLPKIRWPKFEKQEVSVPEPEEEDKERTISKQKLKKIKKKKIVRTIKKSTISRSLKIREKKVIKEFMDKFYSDLNKKKIKLD